MMKIAYISDFGFSDCDFPLIQQMQKEKIDVIYYINLSSLHLKGSLFKIEIDDSVPSGIYPALNFPEFEVYKHILNLNKVFVIYAKNNMHNKLKQKFFQILLRIRILYELLGNKFDIIHLTYPIVKYDWYLYLLRKKMVVTIHDPFPHSNNIGNIAETRNREVAYKLVPKIILLNDVSTDKFVKENNIPLEKVFISRLGEYSMIKNVMPTYLVEKSTYILYYGAISPYKGIEYLIIAFNEISNVYPNLKLVVAGGGKIYFDESLYNQNNNIIIINRYIEIQEIAGLLKGCLFAICPYKDATQSGVVQTAFALDVPLVVTNVGALPKSVKDNVTGLVVPPCNTEALSHAMRRLIDNPGEVEEMKKNIESVWKPANTWGPVVRDYIKCYQS